MYPNHRFFIVFFYKSAKSQESMTNRPICGLVSTLGYSHCTGCMLGHSRWFQASLTRLLEDPPVAYSASIVYKYHSKSMKANKNPLTSMEIIDNQWKSLLFMCFHEKSLPSKRLARPQESWVNVTWCPFACPYRLQYSLRSAE